MSYSVKEQIELAQAWENGEELEWKPIDASDNVWTLLHTKETLLKNRLEEIQFDFNHNEYRIKPKRWRAKPGCPYYYINICGNIISFSETDGYIDAQLHEVGNYFQTEEQAQKVRELFKECLIKFYKENE